MFHAVTAKWLEQTFAAPTKAQLLTWQNLARGESTLLVAPTGSGKTLAAFLYAIDRLMFSANAPKVLYVSPLKALAVDIEKNLQRPLTEIAALASQAGVQCNSIRVAVRTGDTPAKERARLAKNGADILVTTPESLYLMLTSRANAILRDVGLVIVDEIHALVPTKRGAHLALSLERLQRLTASRSERSAREGGQRHSLVRVGLSATQRPLDEVARFLGGFEATVEGTMARPVAIADGRWAKGLELTVHLPPVASESDDASVADQAVTQPSTSQWPELHRYLLEQIRSHRSTLVFANSRRLAERLATALNELASEDLVAAHHGSLAREQRSAIEDQLKLGDLRALVATSSLELGIDMGAIDLVILVESAPSVASAMQRIGRAGHQVGAASHGIIVPKFRGDLLACAALSGAASEGSVESTHHPHNPLDVLCQQIVAMVALDEVTCDDLYDWVRQAAPFADLSRQGFDSCIDLLIGNYASDDFADFRPRLSLDRTTGRLRARPGAGMLAIINGGTIPDRGLFPVVLQGAPAGKGRVGELDEEMVFESRVGEVFQLGASSWRIVEIGFDRVVVLPAPGEPGKMPFWRGENLGRPYEFGQRIGALARRLKAMAQADAQTALVQEHRFSPQAAQQLVEYLAKQAEVSAVPTDEDIVIELGRNEVGDWRICILCPLGGQILAPWCLALGANAKRTRDIDIEAMWTNDGIIVRAPGAMDQSDLGWLFPNAADLRTILHSALITAPVLAARFREAAARALVLTRKRPGMRQPLWMQRKRASDLLAAATRFPSFPLLLEAYRELLADTFDVAALTTLLQKVERGEVQVHRTAPSSPSPFATTLLFSNAGQYLYDADAPPSAHRASALTLDVAKLGELLGTNDFRGLFDDSVTAKVIAQLQLTDHAIANHEQLADLLRRVGELSQPQLVARAISNELVTELINSQRALWLPIGGTLRLVIAEYALRFRDGLQLAAMTAQEGYRAVEDNQRATSQPIADRALEDIVLRFARSNLPFSCDDLSQRFGEREWEPVIATLIASGAIVAGQFRQDAAAMQQYCARDVLDRLHRAAASQRKATTTAAQPTHYSRFLQALHCIASKRSGLDGLLDAVEQLQGVPLPVSQLESDILPARVSDYLQGDLDQLIASGELVWVGYESHGSSDAWIQLYLTDQLPRLHTRAAAEPSHPLDERIIAVLSARGAMFPNQLSEALAPIFAPDLDAALWRLVFSGRLTNDSLAPLRVRAGLVAKATIRSVARFRSRRTATPLAGRWSVVPQPNGLSATEHALHQANTLIARHGVVSKHVAETEAISAGFDSLYTIYKTSEDRGVLHRGYFVADLPAAQFASRASLDLLQAVKNPPPIAEPVVLATIDPANPYGSALPWPEHSGTVRPTRSVGSYVVTDRGQLLAWIAKSGTAIVVFVAQNDVAGRESLHTALARFAGQRRGARLPFVVDEIDGIPAREHWFWSERERAGR